MKMEGNETRYQIYAPIHLQTETRILKIRKYYENWRKRGNNKERGFIQN